MRDQTIPDPLSQDRYDDWRPEKNDCDEMFKNPKFTGFFKIE